MISNNLLKAEYIFYFILNIFPLRVPSLKSTNNAQKWLGKIIASVINSLLSLLYPFKTFSYHLFSHFFFFSGHGSCLQKKEAHLPRS